MSSGTIEEVFDRLTAVYGDPIVPDDAPLGLLLREWREAFAPYHPARLHEAISVCIRTCKSWPTIAQVFGALTPNQQDSQ